MVLAVDDESYAASDPCADAPPRFRDAEERRLHARAYNHWASLLRGRDFPAPGDLDLALAPDLAPRHDAAAPPDLRLDPHALGGAAANSVLIEVAADGAARLRFVGERLRAQLLPEPAGVAHGAPGAIAPGSLVGRLMARLPELLAARAPVGFADEFAASRGSELLCRGILLPLSSDGRTIDLVHGVVNWKEVLSAEATRGLAAEVGSLVRVTRALRPVDPFA